MPSFAHTPLPSHAIAANALQAGMELTHPAYQPPRAAHPTQKPALYSGPAQLSEPAPGTAAIPAPAAMQQAPY